MARAWSWFITEVRKRTSHDLQDLFKKNARNEKLEESRDPAIDIEESLETSMRVGGRPERNRGVRNAPFVVLTGGDMPSVLAEISFLSNPADEQWLMLPDNRQTVAEGLYHGIEEYFRNSNSLTTELAYSSGRDRQLSAGISILRATVHPTLSFFETSAIDPLMLSR